MGADSDRRSGRVRLLTHTLEATMPIAIDRPMRLPLSGSILVRFSFRWN